MDECIRPDLAEGEVIALVPARHLGHASRVVIEDRLPLAPMPPRNESLDILSWRDGWRAGWKTGWRDGWWTGWFARGCIAEGATAEQAVHNLESAAREWIRAALLMGQDVPEPAINAGYSGHFALRLPRSLHRQASRLAERDGTSLNQFLVSAIAARTGAEDFYNLLAKRFERRMALTAANYFVESKSRLFQREPTSGAGAEVLSLDEPLDTNRREATSWQTRAPAAAVKG